MKTQQRLPQIFLDILIDQGLLPAKRIVNRGSLWGPEVAQGKSHSSDDLMCANAICLLHNCFPETSTWGNNFVKRFTLQMLDQSKDGTSNHLWLLALVLACIPWRSAYSNNWCVVLKSPRPREWSSYSLRTGPVLMAVTHTQWCPEHVRPWHHIPLSALSQGFLNDFRDNCALLTSSPYIACNDNLSTTHFDHKIRMDQLKRSFFLGAVFGFWKIQASIHCHCMSCQLFHIEVSTVRYI